MISAPSPPRDGQSVVFYYFNLFKSTIPDEHLI